MSEDWNSGGGSRKRPPGRELTALRARYTQHRETLKKLAADAPTDHMAQLYARVTAEIDAAVRKLDELEKGDGGALTMPLTAPEEPARPLHPAMVGAEDRLDTREWQPQGADVYSSGVQRDNSGLRKGIIALIAIAAVALLGWFAWSSTRPDNDAPAVVEATDTAARAEADATPPVVEASPLTVNPSSFDFGAVPKGTRKTGRFQLTNNSDATIPIAISRSQCRCLWFQHPQIIPPNSTATLTVTVDGARAKSGNLSEIVTLSSKEDAITSADLELTAAIQ